MDSTHLLQKLFSKTHTVSCPSCGLQIAQSRINSHLDSCLSSLPLAQGDFGGSGTSAIAPCNGRGREKGIKRKEAGQGKSTHAELNVDSKTQFSEARQHEYDNITNSAQARSSPHFQGYPSFDCIYSAEKMSSCLDRQRKLCDNSSARFQLEEAGVLFVEEKHKSEEFLSTLHEILVVAFSLQQEPESSEIASDKKVCMGSTNFHKGDERAAGYAKENERLRAAVDTTQESQPIIAQFRKDMSTSDKEVVEDEILTKTREDGATEAVGASPCTTAMLYDVAAREGFSAALSGIQACPICGQEFLENEGNDIINSHIDECLNEAAGLLD